MPQTARDTDFNRQVKEVIDEVVLGLTGPDVLASLNKYLESHYDVTPEEVPYRIDTLLETLEMVFGVRGSRTIGKAIAKRVYARFNLNFHDTGVTLDDYLNLAKKELAKGNRRE